MVTYTKYCLRCGKKFECKNKSAKYCSKKCRSKSFICTCQYCKFDFFGVQKNQPYCSYYCRHKDFKSVQKKIEKTNLKLYGVKNPFQSEEIKEKIRKTNLEKYGAKHYIQTKDYRERFKKTCLEKYGVEYILQSKKIQEKVKKTNLERYGHEWNIASKKIREKTKNSFIKKYGVKNPFQSEEIKEKIKETNLKKYGVFYPSQKHIINYENYNEKYIKENFIKNNYFLVDDLIDYFNIDENTARKLKIKFNIQEPIKSVKIKTQLSIYDYITSIYKRTVEINERLSIKPKELDIYIPSKNIAIEYDGIYYHSFGKLNVITFNKSEQKYKYNHLQKTELCEKQNIKLFHIFENEWINPTKQEIWKSVIKNSLGLIENKIYARKCKLKIINDNSYLEFLENNHLQGYKSSSINIGLYYKDELVSLMTFGKSRFNKNYDWELLRFCNKINTNVIGSFSKLISYFKNHYQGKIISYGNRRWCSLLNNVYEKNGGKLIRISKPNYFYFKYDSFLLESRLKYQKHKLKDKLETFDKTLTETENMYNNGYRKIYDCGNLVYEL